MNHTTSTMKGVRMSRWFFALILLIVFQSSVLAEPLTLAAGAGYKRPLADIIQQYEASGGDKINQIYGNMGQVMMQAKGSGTIALIVGESTFLKSSGLQFASFHDLGAGVLVLAFSKETKLQTPEDLLKPEITRVALPDEKYAVYGKAAKAFLRNAKMFEKIEKKLLFLKAVPQVSAYLISGEVEAGFINLTDALYVKDKIGGYLTPDRSMYQPIKIVVGALKGYEEKPETKKFLSFVTTDPRVKEILKKSGL